MNMKRPILIVAFALATAACASPASEKMPPPETAAPPAPPTTTTAPTTTTIAPLDTTTSTESAAPATTDVATSVLSSRVTTLDSALYEPADHQDDEPIPTSISIGSIDVAAAPVVGVGVGANGDMEIPGANRVGWYRFNARPGAQGSAVLAAHISFDGTPGVFRHLDAVAVGDTVMVGFDDGSEAAFEIVETVQYEKAALPLDRIFAKDGDPVLTLITCGGDFNRSLRSYEDNVVTYAVPIGESALDRNLRSPS
jgi:LPXTG-site transpeptidase (sortase) family protein